MPRLVTAEDLSQSKVTRDLTAQCNEPGRQGLNTPPRAEDGTFRCVTVTLLSFITFLGDLRLSPEEEETKMHHEAPPDSKVQVRVKLCRKTTNKCGKSQTACG